MALINPNVKSESNMELNEDKIITALCAAGLVVCTAAIALVAYELIKALS